MKKNFSSFLFRASKIGLLMTPSKGKSTAEKLQEITAKRDDFQKKAEAIRDGLKSKQNYIEKVQKMNSEIIELEAHKDDIVLSSTAKEYLNSIYIEEVYGRKDEFSSKYTEKGNYAEEDSLTLVTQNLNKLLVKNEKEYSNAFVKGTPDVVTPALMDVKTKWDIFGFMNENGKNNLYYWQLQTYMWLVDVKVANLIYTLVNAPDFLIEMEFNKIIRMEGIEDGSEEMARIDNQINLNMKYDDIAPVERMKIFTFYRSGEDIALMEKYITYARRYLSELDLNQIQGGDDE